LLYIACDHSSILLFTTSPPAEFYALSLHDALPISGVGRLRRPHPGVAAGCGVRAAARSLDPNREDALMATARREMTFLLAEPERSEEHTSELQSLRHLVCRPLLEKKKTTKKTASS